jgi:paraquat-inducible protein B
MQEQMPTEGRAEIDPAQTLRSMIAHTDERFQALAVRIAGLEDYLSGISSNLRALREAADAGTMVSPQDDPFTETSTTRGAAIAESMGEVNTRLDELESHLAAAFEHLAGRDRLLVDTLTEQIHAESAQALERVEALEGHVREGSLAMGSLVEAVQEEVRTLSELGTREIAVDPANIGVELERAMDEKVRGLAALIRSDSMRIAELVQQGMPEGATGQGGLTEILDARIGRMSELVSATTMSAVAEVARKVPEETVGAVSEKIEEMTISVDRDFVALTDTIDAQLRRMGHAIAEEVAHSTDASLAQRLNGAAAGTAGGANVEHMQQMIDERMTQLARLIRSDNKAMASVVEIAAQQEAAKQAARSVKEMQASLPAELLDAIDRRFHSFAESMHRETQATVEALAKTAEVLAQRIDQTTASLDERYDRDMRAVSDRLGRVVDAIDSARGGSF